MMNTSDMQAEIKELNLTYLMLAQHMIHEDKAAAVYRLGISQQSADILGDLTASQVLRMAGANVLLCRMRCDSRLILEQLANHGKDSSMPQSHAAILLAGMPAEEMV
jgi:flagellar transcriptional activator FlhD